MKNNFVQVPVITKMAVCFFLKENKITNIVLNRYCFCLLFMIK